MLTPAELLPDLSPLCSEPVDSHSGQGLTVKCRKDQLYPLVEHIQKRHQFHLLLDITAVDRIKAQSELVVIYQFSSTLHTCRLCIKVAVSVEKPSVPTLINHYPSASFHERETHEMYGVLFEGNSDLRHLLLYEGFVGYPLRKDYNINDEQPIHQIVDPPIIKSSIEGPSMYANDQRLVLNMGPSHPATHGTIQIIAELSGEFVEKADIHCGYLHRGFEKECERHNYQNIIPFTDRLNYCSPLINNFAFAEAVEKMAGIILTPRCLYLRTLLSECSRLTDHLTCIGANLMELGAMTPFLYLITIRDYLYEHLAKLTGARITHSYVRFGGVNSDEIPAGWLERLEEILKFYEDYVLRVHILVGRNRIFVDRMRNTGVLTREDALAYGFTGPILRSTGIAFDLRKHAPYLAYAELDFKVPVGLFGDNYDRYYVRMEEMDQSVSIIRQCTKKLSTLEGPLNGPKYFKFPKSPNVPAGEIYVAHEGGNGEVGFYVVSEGGKIPYKVHLRAPSFVHMGGMHKMLEGGQYADIVATFGTVNMIGGECDR